MMKVGDIPRDLIIISTSRANGTDKMYIIHHKYIVNFRVVIGI